MTAEDAKIKSYIPNLESSNNQMLEDNSINNLETPSTTTESPSIVVTKRPLVHKSSEDTRESSLSHQHEVPSSTVTSAKVISNSPDNSAKSSNEKIESLTKMEMKIEEMEQKQKNDFEKEKPEQEPIKTSTSQDQNNFDGLDLKDIEVENNNNVVKNDPLNGQQSTTNTPQQKESVFQRLSNRIKVSFF